MRVLVTGGSGFAGEHLIASLTRDGHHVFCFDARDGQDVRDYEAIRTAVARAEPDQVYHLAAVAWPRESLADPRRCMEVNVTGTLNLLEAIRCAGPEPAVLLAGTSEEYGYEGRDGEPLTERSACMPTTPYGVSKLAAGMLGLTYARRFGLTVTVTRAFNHTGPGRQAVNAESAFARRIVACERGEADHVPHGDLSSVRNFTDVRDVVRAYRAVIGHPGIWNVCSSRNARMAEVMDIMLARSPLRAPQLKPIAGLGTPDAGGFPEPSHAKLTAATGWEPQIPLEQTLADLLDYWRSR